MSVVKKTAWLLMHMRELGPGDLAKFLSTTSEGLDPATLAKLSAGELLNLITDPRGISLFTPLTTGREDDGAASRPSLPELTREQIEELLKIDSGWRRAVGASLNHRFGRVSEKEFNRALDLIGRMEGFKNTLLKTELGNTPFRRLLYRQLTEKAHTATSMPERLETMADFFHIASQRTQDKKLQLLLDSISRHAAIFHIEFVSFRTIERFFIFEMRRELRKLKTQKALGVDLSENENKVVEFLENTVGEGNRRVVKRALSFPGAIVDGVLNFISPKSSQNYGEQKGHEAFIEVLNKISNLGSGDETPLSQYAERANALSEFFESNRGLTTELLERTSNISPHEIPARLREELRTLNSSGGKSKNGEIIKHPRGFGVKNSLIYERNRFVGFVGTTLHFYVSILLSDELLRLTYYTGEYRDEDAPPPFFSSSKELLFNIGSHIHFATFSIYVAANRSAYRGAIRGLVTRLPILKFIAGANPVGLLFSEFVGFMPGMTANNAMWSSIAHSATPEAYFLLTRGYFEEAGRLVSAVWRERVAQLSLAAKMGTITGVFYAMRLGQQLIVYAFRGATAATYVVNPVVGFAWTVATFALAAVVEHYLAPWYTTLEANSYIDASTENLVDAEMELASEEELVKAIREIPGLEDGIQKRFGVWPQTYLYFRDYYDKTNDKLREFIEECWASILTGEGEFGKLVYPLIDHPEAKEIVNRINLIEKYMYIKERHITTGMSSENSGKELQLALQYIDDLSTSFDHHLKHKTLEHLPYLFEKAARINIYSIFVPTQFSDAKGLIASDFSMEKAYMEYENAWAAESILAGKRDQFIADLSEILRNRNDLQNMDEGTGNNDLSADIDKHLASFSKEIAAAALRLEVHEIMKKDFWRRCRASGFLALDGWKRERHPCAREQREVEFEWREIRSAPASRFILDNYDPLYKTSSLYEWAHKNATGLRKSSQFYIGDGPEWVSEKGFYINSADGGATFTKPLPDTPWYFANLGSPGDGEKLARDFVLTLNVQPKTYDDDLYHVEEQGSGLLLYKLQKSIKENNLAGDLDLHSDIQSSWIRALITDPISGNYNEREYSEAAKEVRQISERDWSVLDLYNKGKINKKSIAAKTTEELAFYLNGYARAERENIGAATSRTLQAWWLKKSIDAAEALVKERESLRLITDGMIPIPRDREWTKLEPYRQLMPNPYDKTNPEHRFKASDMNDPAINMKVVEFFSRADPTGVLNSTGELPGSITMGMTNPYVSRDQSEQSLPEEAILPSILERILTNIDEKLKAEEMEPNNINDAREKAIRWVNTILLEKPESLEFANVYTEIVSILTEEREYTELFDFAYNVNELIQANDGVDDSIRLRIELFERAKEFILDMGAQKSGTNMEDIAWKTELLASDGFQPSEAAKENIDPLIAKLSDIEDGKELLKYLIYLKGKF